MLPKDWIERTAVAFQAPCLELENSDLKVFDTTPFLNTNSRDAILGHQ